MESSAIAQIAGLVVVLGGAVAVICRYIIDPIVRMGRQLTRFFTDWFGEEARDGVAARPGMMARVAGVEHKAMQHSKALVELTGKPLPDIHETHPKIT